MFNKIFCYKIFLLLIIVTSWVNRILYPELAAFAVANTEVQNNILSGKPNGSENANKRHCKIDIIVTIGKFLILIIFLREYKSKRCCV